MRPFNYTHGPIFPCNLLASIKILSLKKLDGVACEKFEVWRLILAQMRSYYLKDSQSLGDHLNCFVSYKRLEKSLSKLATRYCP